MSSRRKDLVAKTNQWAAELGLAPSATTGNAEDADKEKQSPGESHGGATIGGGLRFVQGYISEESGKLEEGTPDVRCVLRAAFGAGVLCCIVCWRRLLLECHDGRTWMMIVNEACCRR